MESADKESARVRKWDAKDEAEMVDGSTPVAQTRSATRGRQATESPWKPRGQRKPRADECRGLVDEAGTLMALPKNTR